MKIYLPVILFILFSLLSGCSQEENPVNSNNYFSGIAITDTSGILITDDPDDWQPRYGGGPWDDVYFSPAYPNPAGNDNMFYNDTLRAGFFVVLQMPATSHIVITLFKNPDTMLFKDEYQDVIPGKYNFFIDIEKHNLTKGIYRIYFDVNMENNHYTSFGDVEVNR
jgi:hypothetical protein